MFQMVLKMTKSQNAIFFVVMFLLGTFFVGTIFAEEEAVQGASSESAYSKEEKEWGNAPDFTLPQLENGEFTLSFLKGKVIILDFWATRCPPCRKEIPGFIELYKKYKDKGLEIVGVCLEDKATIKPFAEKMGMNYILVFADQKISHKYGGIRYIPTTFIIDQQGDIAKKHVGYVSKEVFEEEIKKMLNN